MIEQGLPPQTIRLEAASTIGDNLIPIIVVLASAIVIMGLLKVIESWDKYRNRVKLDELEAKRDKLRTYANYQKRRSLRDAVSMLEPEERMRLYSIWGDNAVVSRKAIFRMNELEDRLRRAERGAELRWAESRIGEVRETEKRLFPEAFPSRRGGSR